MRKIIALGVALTIIPVAAAAYITTSMGEQATVTPSVRLLEPAKKVYAGEPIAVKVQYSNFDLRPDLRCNPAGSCTGSLPQTLNGGVVQGHAHVYFIPEGATTTKAVSFCIPSVVTPAGTGGTATGTCPALLEPGVYRAYAELQSNSHVSILKAGPQDVPTTDQHTIKVKKSRQDPDDD